MPKKYNADKIRYATGHNPNKSIDNHNLEELISGKGSDDKAGGNNDDMMSKMEGAFMGKNFNKLLAKRPKGVTRVINTENNNFRLNRSMDDNAQVFFG